VLFSALAQLLTESSEPTESQTLCRIQSVALMSAKRPARPWTLRQWDANELTLLHRADTNPSGKLNAYYSAELEIAQVPMIAQVADATNRHSWLQRCRNQDGY
jgi:hypothetical protein